LSPACSSYEQIDMKTLAHKITSSNLNNKSQSSNASVASTTTSPGQLSSFSSSPIQVSTSNNNLNVTMGSTNSSLIVSPPHKVKANKALQRKNTFDPIGEEIRKLEHSWNWLKKVLFYFWILCGPIIFLSYFFVVIN